MRIEDALSILNIVNVDNLTLKDVKKAYRKSCQKYHPDKGGSVHMMQSVNEAYSTLKNIDFSNFDVDIESCDFQYPDDLNNAINAVIDLEGVKIEVCGNWVWLTGNTKPHKDKIGRKGAGYFWAKNKRAWYFRPPKYKSAGRGTFTLDEIRDRHGSQFVRASRDAQRQIGVS